MGCTSSTPYPQATSLGSSTNRTMSITETERVMEGRIGIDKSERIPRRHKAPPQSRPNEKAAPPKLDANGRLTDEEVASRRSGSGKAMEVVLGDVRGDDEGWIHASYAVMTQRGYHPDQPHKPNQDDYHITPTKFASGEGDALFAVFDGHGAKGHDCAAYAKSKFSSLLASHIKKARANKNAAKIKANPSKAKEPGAFHPNQWPYLLVEEYERCCREACLGCNKAMHQDNTVADTMSGTTAIVVSFHAGNMTVTNIGDSRAVLGYRIDSDILESCSASQSEEKKEISDLFARDDDDDDCLVNAEGKKLSEGDIVAIALSQDQTPYRKDERDRLKNAGARICTIDQMEGKEPMHEKWGEFELGVDINFEGDIPRVWCAEHNYPGTAFSRSLGDSVAEHIGVNADPEILTKKVTKGDEFLVIATDGIFEFLTNQRVIDICATSNDPAHACSRLLEASYEMWLAHETRTDDITCIVLFLKNTIPNDVEVMKDLICQKHQVIGAKKILSRDLSMARLTTPKSLE